MQPNVNKGKLIFNHTATSWAVGNIKQCVRRSAYKNMLDYWATRTRCTVTGHQCYRGRGRWKENCKLRHLNKQGGRCWIEYCKHIQIISLDVVVVEALRQQDRLNSWPKIREPKDRRGRDRGEEVGGNGCITEPWSGKVWLGYDICLKNGD
jgi:hypothetical protein